MVLLYRFIIHSFQKILLMKKIGLNQAIILGANQRGLDVFNSLNNHSHHGINVMGFIKSFDDPNYEDEKFPLPILCLESSMNKLIALLRSPGFLNGAVGSNITTISGS